MQRAFSNYIHEIYYHRAHYDPFYKEYANTSLYEKAYDLSFEEALKRQKAIRSPYHDEIEYAYSLFGKENILVLVLERDLETGTFNQKMSRFLGIDLACENLKWENIGGYLPFIFSPEEDISMKNDKVEIQLRKGNVYIFLSKRHGIAYWEDVPKDAISHIIDASGKWSSYVPAFRVSELRQMYFADDIARLEQLIGYELPEWRVSRPLQVHRWFGVGPLKLHNSSVHAAMSIFSVDPKLHPFK